MTDHMSDDNNNRMRIQFEQFTPIQTPSAAVDPAAAAASPQPSASPLSAAEMEMVVAERQRSRRQNGSIVLDTPDMFFETKTSSPASPLSASPDASPTATMTEVQRLALADRLRRHSEQHLAKKNESLTSIVVSADDDDDDDEYGDDDDDDDGGTRKKCCKYAVYQHEILPYMPARYMGDLHQVKTEVLAGITVAFAQVSESIAFAFIAGVGPLLGLHAAWMIGLIISFGSSRSGMVNGATGVRAAVVAPYVSEHGVGMLFYIVMWTGVFQILSGIIKVTKYVRMVPRPAMIGFVNGLAIILALGQLPQFRFPDSSTYRPVDEILWMLTMAGVTVLASLYLPRLPRVGKLLPPSLLGIVAAIIMEFALVRPSGFSTPSVGDIGEVSGGLPKLFFVDSQYDGELPPFNADTIFSISMIPGFIAAAAGTVEALLTLEVVNDLTDTTNLKPDRHMFALGIGNVVCGLFGTMGGGATIGLTMINLQNGANGLYRISTYVAGFTMLLLILAASPIIKIIPSAALVGVMAIVVFHTFEWRSVPMIMLAFTPKQWRDRYKFSSAWKISRFDAVVIVVVTVVTLVQDLAVAVFAGIIISALAFAWQEGGHITVRTSTVRNAAGAKVKVYHIEGPVFFASAMELTKLIKPSEDDPMHVEIHFHTSEISDYTAIYTLNELGAKFKKFDKQLHLRYLSDRSLKILKKADKLATHFTYTLKVDERAGDGIVLQPPQQLNVLSNYDKVSL